MFRNKSIENASKKLSPLKGDSLWEQAAMCAYIYGGFELPPFDSDFKLYNTFRSGPDDQGYYGACFIDLYESEGDKKVDIIFVHRGTVFNFNNLIDDLRIAMGYAPEVYKVALKYVSNTINALAKQHGSNTIHRIENTGHSLGGVISDLVTLKLYSSMSSHFEFYSTTFENPGSKAAVEQFIKRGELPKKVLKFAKEYCWNFANDINVINCCQEQVGVNNGIRPLAHNYFHNDRIPSMPEAKPCVTNRYYLLAYTADQHQIIKTYNALKEHYEWDEDIVYPIGLKNSYNEYFSYNSRKNYWDSYMKILWDIDPTQKDKFKGIYKNYESYFIENLGRIKNEIFLSEDFTNTNVHMSKYGLFNEQSDNKKIKSDKYEIDSKFLII